jgi:amylosucrase
VVLKAEAIVGPDLLVPYLGGHERFRPECDLAYDNQLMVMLWSALAARDATLPAQALRRRRTPPVGTGWVTYVRCHDDIGWAIADEDARAVGWDGFAHRSFLARFYAGDHEGSFARGLYFQVNEATGDARTSGTAASLAGLEAALDRGDRVGVDAALARLVTLYAVVYSFGGIPLLYMGDEIALLNHREWAADPAHADDNRWVHRPPMDWAAAARRDDPTTVEGRMFAALCSLGAARRTTQALRSDATCTVLPVSNPHVLAYLRTHPRAAPVLVLANFSDTEEGVPADILGESELTEPVHLHSTAGRLELRDGQIRLPAWGHLWVTTP